MFVFYKNVATEMPPQPSSLMKMTYESFLKS